MTSARHMKKDPNWTTPGAGQPIDYVALIRRCLGGVIDLDPFSSLVANRTMGARRIFTEADDGFAQPWDSDAIAINPPGLMVVRAWRKLLDEVEVGRARGVMWIGFSVEQLCLLADQRLHPLDFSCVHLRKRISFVREDGTTGSPAHANYACGVGVDHALFESTFGALGKVTAGACAMA